MSDTAFRHLWSRLYLKHAQGQPFLRRVGRATKSRTEATFWVAFFFGTESIRKTAFRVRGPSPSLLASVALAERSACSHFARENGRCCVYGSVRGVLCGCEGEEGAKGL